MGTQRFPHWRYDDARRTYFKIAGSNTGAAWAIASSKYRHDLYSLENGGGGQSRLWDEIDTWIACQSETPGRKGYWYSPARAANYLNAYWDHFTCGWIHGDTLDQRIKDRKENPPMPCSSCNHVCNCSNTSDPFALTRHKLEGEIAVAQRAMDRLSTYEAMTEPDTVIRWSTGRANWLATRSGSGWNVFTNDSLQEREVPWSKLVTVHLICADNVEIAEFSAPSAPAESGASS